VSRQRWLRYRCRVVVVVRLYTATIRVVTREMPRPFVGLGLFLLTMTMEEWVPWSNQVYHKYRWMM
jgi:predicted alpha/beta hydrolase